MKYPIYILAEGKSSRMGIDKGLVKINGKEMVLHCIENILNKNLEGPNPNKQKITIITNNPAYKKFGYRIISDKIKNQGPAQGVITALEDLHQNPAECKNEACLILSVDMPLVDDLMIRQFDNLPVLQAGLIINWEIICFKNDFLYPFPGIYSKSILPAWKEKVSEQNYKMQWLIKQFDYKTLPIDQPDLFLNVNTPEDILKAEEKLR